MTKEEGESVCVFADVSDQPQDFSRHLLPGDHFVSQWLEPLLLSFLLLVPQNIQTDGSTPLCAKHPAISLLLQPPYQFLSSYNIRLVSF